MFSIVTSLSLAGFSLFGAISWFLSAWTGETTTVLGVGGLGAVIFGAFAAQVFRRGRDQDRLTAQITETLRNENAELRKEVRDERERTRSAEHRADTYAVEITLLQRRIEQLEGRNG